MRLIGNPATAVNEEEGRGFVRLCLVEIKHLAVMRAVRHV